MKLFSVISALLATVAPQVAAQVAFAHVIVGNTFSYNIDQWKSDIRLAAAHGIDGFVLNIAPPFSGNTATQMSYSFQAANQLRGSLPLDFKMFFSFDFLGGGSPWSSDDIISIMKAYGPNGAHYQVDGKPMVSTFEGPQNSDINMWNGIRSSVPGGIYFVPDWTSLGPNGFNKNLVDGAFSWDQWPNGPQNITTDNDQAWINSMSSAGKSFMMGISPWFYTDLPGYSKAWVWRGDDMWHRRWQQAIQLKPRFVEIVTWNDFGESHYIGPIYSPGIPSADNADARPYVANRPHQAWLQTLSYQIAAYKHAYNPSAYAAPSVNGQDKIVYWYRTAPASAGSTDATGNNCKSAINKYGYQQCYPIPQILEDAVFAIVLASNSGTARISIGGSSSSFSVSQGINLISKSFNGATGTVGVGFNSISGSGVAITSQPDNGKANFNAWVGCAGSCS